MTGALCSLKTGLFKRSWEIWGHFLPIEAIFAGVSECEGSQIRPNLALHVLHNREALLEKSPGAALSGLHSRPVTHQHDVETLTYLALNCWAAEVQYHCKNRVCLQSMNSPPQPLQSPIRKVRL